LRFSAFFLGRQHRILGLPSFRCEIRQFIKIPAGFSAAARLYMRGGDVRSGLIEKQVGHAVILTDAKERRIHFLSSSRNFLELFRQLKHLLTEQSAHTHP